MFLYADNLSFRDKKFQVATTYDTLVENQIGIFAMICFGDLLISHMQKEKRKTNHAPRIDYEYFPT